VDFTFPGIVHCCQYPGYKAKDYVQTCVQEEQYGRCHQRSSSELHIRGAVCVREEQGQGGTYHGVHFRKGVALILVVVGHVDYVQEEQGGGGGHTMGSISGRALLSSSL